MKKFELVALEEDELIEIAEEHDISIECIDYDMGLPSPLFKGEYDLWDELIDALKKHFKVESLYMFSADTDQEFPAHIMIILGWEAE